MLLHWDDGPEQLAIGTVRIGARRRRLAPGAQTSRAAAPGAEAMAFVLAGSGLSSQDGTATAIRAGDALLHPPGAALVLRAGDEGLDVLLLGPRTEAADGDPGAPPPTIAAIADVPGAERDRGEFGATIRNVGVALGSQSTGMRHAAIAPGRLNAPPHCHSAEEELFVVLEGEGHLLLGDEAHEVRRGCVVSRPPGTAVAHTFRGGRGGLELLAYGMRRPDDVCYYPRSNKIFWPGLGVVGRIEHVDFWEGEEL